MVAIPSHQQSQPTRAVRVVLVGDSTVTDDSGWGAGFGQLALESVEVINLAANGRSSKSYMDEGRWKEALARCGHDHLIQFGHNDEPGKGPERETDPETTFRANIVRYVEEARGIGATPVLVTSLVRRIYNEDGTIETTQTPYVTVVRAIALEKNVPLVDLHAISKTDAERPATTSRTLSPRDDKGVSIARPQCQGGASLDASSSTRCAPQSLRWRPCSSRRHHDAGRVRHSSVPTMTHGRVLVAEARAAAARGLWSAFTAMAKRRHPDGAAAGDSRGWRGRSSRFRRCTASTTAGPAGDRLLDDARGSGKRDGRRRRLCRDRPRGRARTTLHGPWRCSPVSPRVWPWPPAQPVAAPGARAGIVAVAWGCPAGLLQDPRSRVPGTVLIVSGRQGRVILTAERGRARLPFTPPTSCFARCSVEREPRVASSQ